MDSQESPKMTAKTLKVYLSPASFEQITAKAKEANLAASKYAAHILMGYEIAGSQEMEAIRELGRTNALFGKLTGLLKMGLKEHPDMTALRPLLSQIENEKGRMKQQYEEFLRRFNL